MAFTYPKAVKLKSKKTIDQLFSEGKSVARFPLRLVYLAVDADDEPSKMGVSVSKKYFKKAVDRNYYKRVLRECYRLNQSLLTQNESNKKYVMMLLYQSAERLSYQEVDQKTKELFQKFVLAESKTK